MSGFRPIAMALAVLGLVAVISTGAAAAGSNDDDGNRRILLRDDCDRNDPAWNLVGGCTKRGNVTFAEFNEEVADTPLSLAVVGHLAWWFDPNYLVLKQGKSIRVKNVGGRPHTFTKVAEWGGGNVPPLNEGLAPAPECPAAVTIPPGGKAKVSGLTAGNHRFLCCFHPWMRTLIKVKPKSNGKHDD